MKQLLPFLFLLVLSFSSKAQDFTGQWKGSFIDQSTKFMTWGGDKCDYVLELDCNGTKVTGYSYTYFSDGGRKYYTICRLVGSIDKGSKIITVKEVERTKTNVPSNIRNCFQVHKLVYSKQGETQAIAGSWEPAPNQEGDCGYGTTRLVRRVLQKNASLAKIPAPPKSKTTVANKPVVEVAKAKTITPFKAPLPKKTVPPVVATAKSKTQPVLVAKADVKNPPKPAVKPTLPQSPPVANNSPVIKIPETNSNPPEINRSIPASYEKRDNNLLKTIDIENETFKVDLYDNGEIDGDSISLFFNGKLLLAHKRLSDKALTLTLNVDNDVKMNELIMYADNLGSIPPNTALMVITDGNKRYEARISSDLEKSGVIRFIHKPKTVQ